MIPGRPADRFSLRRGAVASLGVTATVLACFAAGVPAAQATSDADQSGAAAVFGDWKLSDYTEWTTDATPPADVDGQAGEDNLANVTQIGELHTKLVPGTPAWKGPTGCARARRTVGSRPTARSSWTRSTSRPPTPPIPTDVVESRQRQGLRSGQPSAKERRRFEHATSGNPQSGNHAFEGATHRTSRTSWTPQGVGPTWFTLGRRTS